MQLRDTTENFPNDDEIFGCWIHTIDFALDFHWKSIFSEKKSESEYLFWEIFFKSTQKYFLWIDFQKSGRFEKEKSSPFILHHKLACFIDGNTREHRPGPPKPNAFFFHDLQYDSLLSGEQVVDSSELCKDGAGGSLVPGYFPLPRSLKFFLKF